MTRTLSWLIGAVVMLVATPTWAVVLFELLPYNGVTLNGAQISLGTSVASNFSVAGASPVKITELRFWTLEGRESVWPGTVTYTFWESDGDVPAQTPIVTGVVPTSGVTRTKLGEYNITGDTDRNPFTQYFYTLNLLEHFYAQSNRRYWLSLFMGAGSKDILWQYSVSSNPPRPRLNINPPGEPPDWSRVITQGYPSFMLVPIPGTVLLLLLGLVGVAAARGRRR